MVAYSLDHYTMCSLRILLLHTDGLNWTCSCGGHHLEISLTIYVIQDTLPSSVGGL